MRRSRVRCPSWAEFKKRENIHRDTRNREDKQIKKERRIEKMGWKKCAEILWRKAIKTKKPKKRRKNQWKAQKWLAEQQGIRL
jgi:hypothetical protein